MKTYDAVIGGKAVRVTVPENECETCGEYVSACKCPTPTEAEAAEQTRWEEEVKTELTRKRAKCSTPHFNRLPNGIIYRYNCEGQYCGTAVKAPEVTCDLCAEPIHEHICIK